MIDPAALPVTAAIEALETALRDGLDPAADTPRTSVGWPPAGELLVMPARFGPYAGVKLTTIAPAAMPRIKGVYVLFDAETLAPLATMDGAALTTLRTPAMTAVAVRALARPESSRLVVFGRGPQAIAHSDAIAAVLPIDTLDFVDVGDDSSFVTEADVICCCTTAREPVFDGSLVRDDAVVAAIGSHEPDARELDTGLMRRSAVVVESIATATKEAGDVILAGLAPESLITIDALIAGTATPAADRPRVWKSAGMAWQDVVVASAVYEASA
jgi:ornithine cyclodeaminase